MDLRIITAAFVCGVYLADRAGFFNILLMSFCVILVCLFRICIRSRVALMLPLSVIVLASGAAVYKASALDEFNKSYNYMHNSVTVTGRICDIPYETEDIMKYTVKADSIASDTERAELHEKFIIYSKEIFDYGDAVSFTGVLKPIKEQMNENGFDTVKYYICRGISGRMNAEQAVTADDLTLRPSLYTAAENIRYSICRLIDKYYADDRGGVLKAVIAGYKFEFSEDMNNILTRTALRRLFYPAYIHMMLLNVLIGCTASVINRRKRDIITAVIFILYMVININIASFVRTFSCAAAMVLSRRFAKRTYYPDILAAAVLVNSIANPMLLYDAGYVTSAAGAIMVRAFCNPLMTKFKISKTVWVNRIIIVGLICTVGMLPLNAYYFNSISVYSIFAAVIFFPAVISIMLAAPVFLGMMYFFGKAPIAGQFMTAISSLMLAVPKIIDRLPFSKIYLQTPSLMFLAAYFLLITAAAYALKKKEMGAKRFAILAVMLFAVCMARSVMRMNTIEIDFVNVGQGDGAVVKVPFGANLLIDGGGSSEYSDYNIGERIYLPYLIDKGITSVDAAFVSHYHKDHVQGIAAALDNIRVKNIFMPESMRDSEWRMTLVDKALKNGSKIWFVSDNTRITFNDGLTIDITVPDTETKLSRDENDTSLLINVSYGEFNCLFTGDMTKTAEKNLVRKGKVPEAEVLKISHHGSRKSTCEEFFAAASPDYSVISLGEDNTYGFPHEELMERIWESEILRTDINGDIRIISDKKGNIKIHTFK